MMKWRDVRFKVDAPIIIRIKYLFSSRPRVELRAATGWCRGDKSIVRSVLGYGRVGCSGCCYRNKHPHNKLHLAAFTPCLSPYSGFPTILLLQPEMWANTITTNFSGILTCQIENYTQLTVTGKSNAKYKRQIHLIRPILFPGRGHGAQRFVYNRNMHADNLCRYNLTLDSIQSEDFRICIFIFLWAGTKLSIFYFFVNR